MPQDWINVIQDCSYINFPSPIRESFLWVMVGCRAMMNCINLNLTISRLNWIRKTSLISRISLKFYLFWIGNKAEKNYEEKWVFHWFLYHSVPENCFYSSTFAIYLRCRFTRYQERESGKKNVIGTALYNPCASFHLRQ